MTTMKAEGKRQRRDEGRGGGKGGGRAESLKQKKGVPQQ